MSSAQVKLAADRQQTRESVRVVLFSGGSGTQSISEPLAKHPQISLTVLINCYDDGHSTGRLRRFLPGMLGPSDVRKNIARLMPSGDACYEALRYLSDYRLPVGIERSRAWSLVDAIACQRTSALPDDLRRRWDLLTVRQDRELRGYCASFAAYGEQQAALGRHFDFTDCALGNIYFAGCYVQNGRDFNKTVDAFCKFYEVRGTLLNLTLGENLFLVAEKHDGSFILSEADLVSSPAKIRRILLLDGQLYLGRIESADNLPAHEIADMVEAAARTPELDERAATALRDADVIIYGPGTQHSSLLPSYLTRNVGKWIAENREADKVFVANVRRDVDISEDDANDLADKLIDSMRRSGTPDMAWRDCVTQFFVQQPDAGGGDSSVPFDASTFRYPLDTVRSRDWESKQGHHHGGYVFHELQQIIQSRIEISLTPKPFMVSIIVPALNEVRTVHDTLSRLVALDFSDFEMSKEVILVDGGSTDGTFESAQSVRSVKAMRLPAGGRGRGAALRAGIGEARGNYILFYPADNEYDAGDIHGIVSQLVKNRHSAVFGVRNAKVLDLSSHLKRLYAGRPLLYLASKYGGLAISVATLALFNRYITDALTSLKGFDSQLLRSLDLQSNGFDMDGEIVAKLCRSQKYILEVPVSFAPRTRAEGKKISAMDGVRTLLALAKYKFKRG